MLPMDHPEFFRLPPPPGQSRESSIRLDGEGRFWHAQELVRHPGMQAAFAMWIWCHPDDGRFILCNGYDWSYFLVEDVPYFVRGLRAEAGGLELALSDGSTEPLDPGSLRSGLREAVYCRVKAGQFDARFMPGAQTALSPHLVETPSGAPGLQLGGRLWPIAEHSVA